MDRNHRIKLYKKIRNKPGREIRQKLTQKELSDALEAGFLVHGFEPFASHNEAIEKAKERTSSIGKQEVADAFLYSLSSSLCEYRSPLLSYSYINSVALHEHDDLYFRPDGSAFNTGFCKVCTYASTELKASPAEYNESESYSFNMANITLMKKYLGGSVCWWAYYIDNCILDITEYIAMPKAPSSDEGKKIFIRALNLVEQLNPTDKANAYAKLLYKEKIIPNSTYYQISTFVDTLGSLNILHRTGDYAITKGKKLYDNSYRDPDEHKNDRPFPLTLWSASDGIDWAEVEMIFGIGK